MLTAIVNGRVTKLESNGSVPVTIQDQTSDLLFWYARRVDNTTTLAAYNAVGDTSVVVADATGITTGDLIDIASAVTNRFYTGIVTGVASTTISLDTPLDSQFPPGATVQTGTKGVNVDGSSTTQIFNLRGGEPEIAISVDITQIIFNIITAGATVYTAFGDIEGGLTKGVVVRRRNSSGGYMNILNVKSNSDMDSKFTSYVEFDPANPAGIYGVTAKATFGGQDNHGSVIRVAPGEDIEFLIQDALNTLTTFEIVIKGSKVVP